jgi:hydrogenase-4 component B
MSETLVLLGIVIAAASGVPGLFLRRTSTTGQSLATILAALAGTFGLAGIAHFWATGASSPIVLPWSLPGAEFNVAMDGLSAIFLAPVFLISLLGSVYGQGYWTQTDHPRNGQRLRFFYGTVTAGMALLVIARNSILFLFGWEIMALSAFFLVNTEDHDKNVREAGWLYLVAAHVATLSLFALFALLRAQSGSFTFGPLNEQTLTPRAATAIFMLALVGFGLKAGIMPLHVWLPSAHAMAPSHVSAMMSGVLLKMGIYGLVRILSFFPHLPREWGIILVVVGVVSGVLGVVFAIGQHDLKRLLAYHSVENIGIIVLGLGLASLGRSAGRPEWVVLGLSGALLHVWNHALFKTLLFLSAGSVIHAVHTREIDHLGGLAKLMPRTALCFLVGAVAICGLPPLNGFVSEFLIYLGLLGTIVNAQSRLFAGAAFAVPALALMGTLATACFVKAYGTVFLGTARSTHAERVHESPANMVAPMTVLVVCCCVIGLAPLSVAPMLQQAVSAWTPGADVAGPRLTALAPLASITAMGSLLIVALLCLSAVLWNRLDPRLVDHGATWGCGYAAPTPRIQYTSSSLGQGLVEMFGWVLRPRTRRPVGLPLFPRESHFESEVPDAVLDEVVLPAARFGAWLFSWARVLQQGNIQLYLLYIFLALIAMLLWR